MVRRNGLDLRRPSASGDAGPFPARRGRRVEVQGREKTWRRPERSLATCPLRLLQVGERDRWWKWHSDAVRFCRLLTR